MLQLYARPNDAYSDKIATPRCLRRKMDEYEPLRQFLELARVLNFGRAARACHVSPSALTRSIQRLEAQLGEPLFERAHHKVTLTPAGDRFRNHALTVIEEWHRYDHERTHQQGSLTGTLHIYCTVTAAQGVVPQLLGELRREHPGIRVELATGYVSDAIDQLRGGRIDASIAALPDRLPAGITSRDLGTTPVVFVAPNADGPVRVALTRRRIDWSSVPLILPAHGVVRDYVDEWLEQRAVLPNIYAEIEGHEAILSLVALGYGVGVVPKLVLDKNALRDQVGALTIHPKLPDLRIALCVRERSLKSPLVAAIWTTTDARGETAE
jgi:LysR family positive regulator for ilvC